MSIKASPSFTFSFKAIALILTVGVLHAGLYYARDGEQKVYPPELKSQIDGISGGADVLYFGDSVLGSIDNLDTIKLNIPVLLQQFRPDRKITVIAQGAFNMDMYLAFCQWANHRGKLPNTVIIPINLRSLSQEWDLNRFYQFEREKYFLKHDTPLARMLYNPLAIFKVISSPPLEKSREAVHQKSAEDRIRSNYSGVAPADHRKIKSLRKLARLLADKKIKTVFYVTPVDVEFCRVHLPPEEFHDAMRKNIAMVREAIEKEGFQLLDLSEALPSASFDSTYRLSEHLNDQGRDFLARTLAGQI